MADDPKVSPLAQALFSAGLSVVCAAAALWLAWTVGWPMRYALDDPDFVNPFAIFIVLLMAGCLWYASRAVLGLLRHRAFGSTVLALDPPGFLRLGTALSGTLRVERAVRATGPFELTLTCHDVHLFEEAQNGSQRQSFPVWTVSAALPATTDAVAGLPFRFVLPNSVGLEPVPSGILPAALHRSRVTIHVPGMRKVIAPNHPPVDRYWTLRAAAPCKGADFQVESVVPLRR